MTTTSSVVARSASAAQSPSYSLLDEPWIPVLRGGRSGRAGLIEALVGAEQIDGLDVADPTSAVAVLRQVLLPVVLDALGAPASDEDWTGLWQRGRLPADVLTAYLEEHRQAFDLFDAYRPFGQAPGLQTTTGQVRPVSVLLPSVATGNSVPLFSAYTDQDHFVLDPADAVLALLRAQCFDTAGIKPAAAGDCQAHAGKTTANPIAPAGALALTVPLGETLAQTLLLNVPVWPADALPGGQAWNGLGRPAWRRPVQTAQWSQREADGLCDLLTFAARRVRLIPEQVGGRTVVSRAVLTAGDRLVRVPAYEPHTLWRTDSRRTAQRAEASDGHVVVPAIHQSDRPLWRSLHVLVSTVGQSAASSEVAPLPLPLAQLAGLRAAGLLPSPPKLGLLHVAIHYGNRNAVVDDVVAERFALPVDALVAGSPVHAALARAMAHAEALRRAVNDLEDDVRVAGGGGRGGGTGPRRHRLGDALADQLSPHLADLLRQVEATPGEGGRSAALRRWDRRVSDLARAAGEVILGASQAQAPRGRRLPDGSGVLRLADVRAQFDRMIAEGSVQLRAEHQCAGRRGAA